MVNPTPAQCNTAVRRLKYANSSINDMLYKTKGFIVVIYTKNFRL